MSWGLEQLGTIPIMGIYCSNAIDCGKDGFIYHTILTIFTVLCQFEITILLFRSLVSDIVLR